MTGLRLRPPGDGIGWLAASGLLLGLAHPPFHLLLPSLLALVPYAVWMGRLSPGEEGRSRALRGGLCLGLLYYSLVLYWLGAALIHFTPLAVPAFLVPVLAFSGLLALATLGVHQAVHRLGWPVWLAVPVFWTAAEWVRGHLGPLSFPWMELGATLTGFPRLIGAADLVGTRGLSFWLALANGLIALAWTRWRAARWRGLRAPLAGTLAVLLLPVGYSLYRWESLEVEPAAEVGVIQPSVPEEMKLERSGHRPGLPDELALQSRGAADSARSAAETLLRRSAIPGAEPDLVVLPETVFPLFVEPIPSADYGGRPGFRRWAGRLARRTDAAVLYGAVGSEDLGGGEFARYNSAFLLDAAGDRVARYDKRRLVPVMERMPLASPDWLRASGFVGGYSAGGRSGVLSAAGSTFGVLICYESIFAGQSRRYRRSGAAFLVNVTNDAWFGRRDPWWSRTSALWQHPAHLVMRAVENRMGAVRSANTGISGLVDPLGRFRRRTPLFRSAALTGTVYTTGHRTLFTEWGDWVGTAAAVLALLTAGAVGRSHRAPGGASPGAGGPRTFSEDAG